MFCPVYSKWIWKSVTYILQSNNNCGICSLMWLRQIFDQCTEVRFATFLSGGFITATVVNQPERKLAPLCIVPILNVMNFPRNSKKNKHILHKNLFYCDYILEGIKYICFLYEKLHQPDIRTIYYYWCERTWSTFWCMHHWFHDTKVLHICARH